MREETEKEYTIFRILIFLSSLSMKKKRKKKKKKNFDIWTESSILN